MQKEFEVEVEVKEIITKTTTLTIKHSNPTMARGVAQHRVNIENPDDFVWSKPLSHIEVVSSKIVTPVDI